MMIASKNMTARVLTKFSADLAPFVCVEVLRPSQPNGVMLTAVSLQHIYWAGFFYSMQLTSIVHSKRKRMTLENIS